MFEIQDDHYSLLEVSSDASFQEIRSAYLRMKGMLSRDNLAGYALMSREEFEDIQRKTEEAYLTLSNPARRREYDRIRRESMHAGGGIDTDPADSPSTDHGEPRKNHGSHPFFDTHSGDAASTPELAVPFTDFLPAAPATLEPVSRPAPHASALHSPHSPIAPSPEEGRAPRNPNLHERRDFSDEIAERLSRETDWSGTLIRWVREKRGLTIEELSEMTKISRSYLVAIEEEHFDKLPASVYLRGFMLQVARYLRLPQDRLIGAYLGRCADARRSERA
jgi:curved DNA-binding protein CbpA